MQAVRLQHQETDMKTNDDAVVSPQEIAADIARELREHPERWFQGELVTSTGGSRISTAAGEIR